MILAGLQKISLVDYPENLAAVIFTQGCNFECGYCQNPDLITCNKTFDFSEKEVFEFITARSNVIEGVVITGGEPSIDKDLPELIKRIKDKGFKVKLDTNGSNSDLIEGLIKERLIDYLALDIKTSSSKYNMLSPQKDIERAVTTSAYLAILSNIDYEFRTTCVPGIVDKEDFPLIGEVVKGAKKYYLQQFQPTITYDRSFRQVTPYTESDLNEFSNILKDYVGSVEVRGL